MKGVFVGLTTLDLINYVKSFPESDEKIQALDRWLGAGGPACNAAITFAALGGEAHLVTALGTSAVADLARADLERNGVKVYDAATLGELATSSIVVDENGRRTVVSFNAGGFAEELSFVGPPTGADVMLADGHHPSLALPALEAGRRDGAVIVFDGGSRKPHTNELVSLSDVVVTSSAFAEGRSAPEVARELLQSGLRLAAVSAGADPLVGATEDGPFSINVPDVVAVDTLGAGDVLHGALAFFLAEGRSPLIALELATQVASSSCASRGPRLQAKT